MIFKYKYESKGNIAKRKAPLVAQEFTHKEEIDYNKTPKLWNKFIKVNKFVGSLLWIWNTSIRYNDLLFKYKTRWRYNMYIPENHEKYKKYYKE